jgi:hypothetical protein
MDNRYSKPFRISLEVSGGDLKYAMDVHGRFRNQREASYTGRDIGARYDSYKEEWGRVVVEQEPPQIELID